LIDWALSNLSKEFRDLVTWSLKEQKPEADWTIELFSEHMDNWLGFFDSEHAKAYALDFALVNDGLGYMYTISQNKSDVPWILLLYTSKYPYEQFAKEQWRERWRRINRLRAVDADKMHF
jgi:hypothetical protein